MRLVVHLIFLARGVFRGVFVLFGIEECASKFGGALGGVAESLCRSNLYVLVFHTRNTQRRV